MMSRGTMLGAVAVYMVFLYFRDMTNPAPGKDAAKDVKLGDIPVSPQAQPTNDASYQEFSEPVELSSEDGFDDELDEFDEFADAPPEPRRSNDPARPAVQTINLGSGPHDILVRFCTS